MTTGDCQVIHFVIALAHVINCFNRTLMHQFNKSIYVVCCCQQTTVSQDETTCYQTILISLSTENY